MKQGNVQWRHMALPHCSAPAPRLPPPQPMLLSVWLWILVCGLLLSVLVSVSGLPPSPPKADNKYLQEAMSPLISAKKLSTPPLSLSCCRRVEIIKRQQGSNLSKFCCLIVVCAVVAVKVLFVYSLRKGMGVELGIVGVPINEGVCAWPRANDKCAWTFLNIFFLPFLPFYLLE